LVTSSYKKSFFSGNDENYVSISTARAGNVIGGGDFADDRIIPDCIRAALSGRDIIVRNPYSTRPYQHVLEPLFAYLMIVSYQYNDPSFAGSYNVGPDESSCINTGQLVDMFTRHWKKEISWINKYDGGPHEANFLKLDCSKIKSTFGWKPKWTVDEAVKRIVEWTEVWNANESIIDIMDKQINEYLCV
jgi:CDP-glucose 4,6-dehydratase